jgi:hypothetical protein
VVILDESMLDKCIHALRDRPAMRRVAIALVLLSAPLDAQTVRTTTLLLSAPGGRELATVRAGADVRAAPGSGAVRQGHTLVTLDGFIAASLLGPGRDSFPNVVKAPRGARLRSAGRPDASILAELRDGMGVNIISRSGDWIRVRRTAWVTTSALATSALATSAATTPATPGAPARGAPTTGASRSGGGAGQSAAGSQSPTGGRVGGSAQQDSSRRGTGAGAQGVPPPGALTPTASIELRTAPEGRAIARIDTGAFLTALARADGWTRIRVEGWVRDDGVIPADTALRLALSGADVRAAPERYRGAVVRWDVEFIAMQRADQLRRDLRAGEPYILARGPGEESGLLYIAVPPALVPDMERLQPLQVITITGRIRVGRSEPAGVPVLDLLTAIRK